jgi:hypothetical protein
MNKQTSVFFLSLTLLASGNTFGQEAPTKEETSCFNNLAALTTENFEQTKNAYAQCLEKEAVRFDTQLSLGLGKAEYRGTVFSKNNSKIEITTTKKFIPFVTKSSEKCSDKTINCAALTSAISDSISTRSTDIKKIKDPEITEGLSLPFFSSMINAKMYNFKVSLMNSNLIKACLFHNEKGDFIMKVSGFNNFITRRLMNFSDNNNADIYACLNKENNQKIINNSLCKVFFDLVQEEYDKQYPDKKA